MAQLKLNFLIVILFFMPYISIASQMPKRAILVVIDGLHTRAPGLFNMPNYNKLAKQGALIQKTCVIMPHHPTHGRYADIHTCSYPNPVMMTGTVFLTARQKMLQHSFDKSAFIANTNAYQSITEGYQFVVQQASNDAFSTDQAINLLDKRVDFIRIHLQDPGTAGYETFLATEDKPYFRDIWHSESPYKKATEEADRQLGRLVEALERRGELENTLLVILGDHGQSECGWHAMLDEQGWLTPMVFHGAGVREGTVSEWADLTDIVPTIAALMNVDIPNKDGGSGRVLKEIIQGGASDPSGHSTLFELNTILKRYAYASAELIRRSESEAAWGGHAMLFEREFFGLERILDWSKKETLDGLLQYNRSIVEQMEALIKEKR